MLRTPAVQFYSSASYAGVVTLLPSAIWPCLLLLPWMASIAVAKRTTSGFVYFIDLTSFLFGCSVTQLAEVSSFMWATVDGTMLGARAALFVLRDLSQHSRVRVRITDTIETCPS